MAVSPVYIAVSVQQLLALPMSMSMLGPHCVFKIGKIDAACCGPNTWNAGMGSGTVFINGKQAHRLGDMTRHCGGVGKLIEGSANVIVGG